MRGLATVAAASALLCVATEARAYVPYRTQAGTPFHWARSCVTIQVYPAGLIGGPPAADVMEAARAAAETWSAAQRSCAAITLVVEQAAGVGPNADPKSAYDHINAVTFHSGAATGGGMPGLTNLYVSNSTGEIQDGDVEIYADSFTWAIVDPDGGATNRYDLQSMLTYSFGHLLGFESPCSSGTPLLDDKGQPAPACSAASAAVRETTMFPNLAPGDTSKRTLEPDDQRAVCETYPLTADGSIPRVTTCQEMDGGAGAGGNDAASPADGGTSPHSSNGGCGCALSGGAAGASALLFALLLLRPRRRRSAT